MFIWFKFDIIFKWFFSHKITINVLQLGDVADLRKPKVTKNS